MAIIASKFVLGALRIPSSEQAGDAQVPRFYIDVTLAQATSFLNSPGNIIDLGILPSNHALADCIFDADALGTSLTFDVGIMSGTPGDIVSARTCGAELFAASNIAVAGTVVARPTLKSAFRIAKVAYDRSIGLKVVAGTSAAYLAGQLGLTCYYAP